MLGFALGASVFGGSILQDALHIALRDTRVALIVGRACSALGRLLGQILFAICVPGAVVCAAVLYMRSWDQSPLASSGLFIFIAGSLIGAAIGFRQISKLPPMLKIVTSSSADSTGAHEIADTSR